MNRHEPNDAGFTLVELLVVLVIMPMIAAAIAAAIIVTQSDSHTTQARLSDSVNAQTTSEYFVRDVQGAQFVTTNSAANPPVCTPVPGTFRTVPPPTLVLGLLQVDAEQSTSLTVGYWTGTAPAPGSSALLVRAACTTSPSGPGHSQQVMSDDVQVPSAPESPTNACATTSATSTTLPASTIPLASVAITPSQFATSASNGWTRTSTSATSISSINLSVTESQSCYTYSLSASPQTWSSPPPS